VRSSWLGLWDERGGVGEECGGGVRGGVRGEVGFLGSWSEGNFGEVGWWVLGQSREFWSLELNFARGRGEVCGAGVVVPGKDLVISGGFFSGMRGGGGSDLGIRVRVGECEEGILV
jgi:hypothetical protein